MKNRNMTTVAAVAVLASALTFTAPPASAGLMSTMFSAHPENNVDTKCSGRSVRLSFYFKTNLANNQITKMEDGTLVSFGEGLKYGTTGSDTPTYYYNPQVPDILIVDVGIGANFTSKIFLLDSRVESSDKIIGDFNNVWSQSCEKNVTSFDRSQPGWFNGFNSLLKRNFTIEGVPYWSFPEYQTILQKHVAGMQLIQIGQGKFWQVKNAPAALHELLDPEKRARLDADLKAFFNSDTILGKKN
jgi:hypothetical protein